VIDIHTHVLPGLDDGAADLEESVALAEQAAADGVLTLVATPHIREDHDVPIAELAARAKRLTVELERRSIPVRILPGGEVATSVAPTLTDEQLRAVSLGGASRYVLLEPPYGPLPRNFEDVVFGLALRGFVAVIAHPERSHDLRTNLERLAELVRRGSLVQVTAAALAGDGKSESARFAAELVERRLAHCLASDSHRAGQRAGIAEARRALASKSIGMAEYARQMTHDVPERLIADEPARVPPPLERGRGRRRAWRRAPGPLGAG